MRVSLMLLVLAVLPQDRITMPSKLRACTLPLCTLSEISTDKQQQHSWLKAQSDYAAMAHTYSLPQSAPHREQSMVDALRHGMRSAGNVPVAPSPWEPASTYLFPCSNLPQREASHYMTHAMQVGSGSMPGRNMLLVQQKYPHMPVSYTKLAMPTYPILYRQAPGPSLSTVRSLVPADSMGQQKRLRQRCEETEKMYKCGWHGCEKAYGTLSHLNGHVTMQSHGPKRMSEEFKEIRYRLKSRKKEVEHERRQAAHKHGQELQRQRRDILRIRGQPAHDGSSPGSILGMGHH